MSFSADIKNELSKTSMVKKCCAVAEIYGILIYAGAFGWDKIKISTYNENVKKRIERLFIKVFNKNAEFYEKNGKFHLNIEDKAIISEIYNTFGYDYANMPLHINFGVLEENCCKAAFLRGAFLSAGSATNPEKKYHWELASHHAGLIREMMPIMQELGFAPKMLKRKNDYIIYFKDSTAIEDLLTCMGAGMSAVWIMQVKVEKGLRNDINRCTNCDDANITKAVMAAGKQIQAINRLKASGKFDSLPESLRKTAEVRLANPELALREMLPLFDPPISKPGLSHRLNKIVALAEREK